MATLRARQPARRKPRASGGITRFGFPLYFSHPSLLLEDHNKSPVSNDVTVLVTRLVCSFQSPLNQREGHIHKLLELK
ncbi:hypothetical protein EVAR_90222_1 [Eumeta japonica]|uniref:Uncharacterized protein n=1 Tax=Eumeta variegata TaxID=151549 RepID=A0A4C1WWC9_EUMVA|nr:hypothetical protein EVAR_90222_1 [Eumeta japonica]